MRLIISNPLGMNQNHLFSYLKVEKLFRNHKRENNDTAFCKINDGAHPLWDLYLSTQAHEMNIGAVKTSRINNIISLCFERSVFV